MPDGLGLVRRLLHSPMDAMKRLAQLLLVVVWVAGAALAGLSEQPVAPKGPGENIRLVAETDRAALFVDDDHVILVVGTAEYAQWQIAAPVPAVLGDWLRTFARPHSCSAFSIRIGGSVASFLFRSVLLLL